MSYGALTQLSAIGEQESNYLSKRPQYSIFNERTKKITNFADRYHTMVPPGKPTWGSKFRMKVDKEGDLLNGIYLLITLPELDINNCSNNSNTDQSNTNFISWLSDIKDYIVKSTKLYIGGQLIDEKVGLANVIPDKLKTDESVFKWLNHHIDINFNIGEGTQQVKKNDIIIQLNFWFSDNVKKGLPIIALQYHDIELEVNINNFESAYNTYKKYTTSPSGYYIDNANNTHPQKDLENVKLIGTYTLLSSEERKKVAEQEHKILITQTQNRECLLGPGPNNTTRTINLDFNHPVKELYFYFQNTEMSKYSPLNLKYFGEKLSDQYRAKYLDDIDTDIDKNKDYFKRIRKYHQILGEARILINGYERVGWQNNIFYNDIQIKEAYKGLRGVNYYYYSFSGKPSADTPMGSLNFSRIDNAQLQIRTNKYNYQKLVEYYRDTDKWRLNDENMKISIHAVNYNYLIIKGGMAGLAYTT